MWHHLKGHYQAFWEFEIYRQGTLLQERNDKMNLNTFEVWFYSKYLVECTFDYNLNYCNRHTHITGLFNLDKINSSHVKKGDLNVLQTSLVSFQILWCGTRLTSYFLIFLPFVSQYQNL